MHPYARSTPLLTLVLTLLALAAPARAQLRLRQPERHPNDPTVDTVYPCYYLGYYAWDDSSGIGAVEGHVYWPSDCASPRPPGLHPLVLLIHGDGHDYTDYGYLLQHFALNGFIAASINGGELVSNLDRAMRIRTYLGFLRYHWAYKDSVENNVALIGHSRGGEAVFSAARKIGEWGLDHDVNALVALAPTDNDQGGAGVLESLSGVDSEALLVLYGSRDEDVRGYCLDGDWVNCGDVPLGPQRTGFALYDRAGSEGETEAFAHPADVVDKCMLFVDLADHNSWREGGCSVVVGERISCQAHKDIAKGYMNAFLRWRLYGMDVYKRFFTGVWTPTKVAADGARIRLQYSQGLGRRVVDDFEQPGWAVGTISSVQKETQVTIVKEGTLFDHPDYTSPHDTRGLVVQWVGHPLTIRPWIRWTIEDGVTLLGARYRDVTPFTHLSFRVGLMHAAPLNPPGASVNFHVRLRDVHGNVSDRIAVDEFTDIAYPDAGSVQDRYGAAGDFPKSAMQTVRIGLGHFQGIDKTDVQDVEIVFADDDHLQGEVLLDSLEFTY